MNRLQRLIAASAIVLSCQLTTAMGQSVDPIKITVPPMPANIEVPERNKVYMMGHAVGTQNYICQISGTTYLWKQLGPQATLFFTFKLGKDSIVQQVATHYSSLNPYESNTARPTWQSSFDTSAVWGGTPIPSDDPNYVAPGAIPWLRLPAVGWQVGPNGGTLLSQTTFIQRLNTAGGLRPTTGCSTADNIGTIVYVPYTADYYFYKAGR